MNITNVYGTYQSSHYNKSSFIFVYIINEHYLCTSQ